MVKKDGRFLTVILFYSGHIGSYKKYSLYCIVV